jgi:hypothetical protein
VGPGDAGNRERSGGRFFSDYASGSLRRENLAEAATRWLNNDDDRERDRDDFAAELEDLGADAEAIAAWEAESDEAEDDDEEALREWELWEENELSVRVFTHCSWTRTGCADGSIVPTSVEATEIRSVCEMLGVPADRLAEVLQDVRYMVSIVLPDLTRRD